MLTDQQLQVIELLALGELTKAEISKKVGISDRVIYKWQNNEEFKAKWKERADSILNSLEHEGKARMVSKGQIAIDNILHMANTAHSEKVKLDANIFIYESIFGKATTRLQDVSESKEEPKVSTIDLQKELSKFKVISSQKDKKTS